MCIILLYHHIFDACRDIATGTQEYFYSFVNHDFTSHLIRIIWCIGIRDIIRNETKYEKLTNNMRLSFRAYKYHQVGKSSDQ